jgi:hypothetical protein
MEIIMRTFTFAFMATCILGSSLMADECPAPEKISEALMKGFEELQKTVATAAGIGAADIDNRLSLRVSRPGINMTKLSKSEEPNTSYPEFKSCLYFGKDLDGKKTLILGIAVKK